MPFQKVIRWDANSAVQVSHEARGSVTSYRIDDFNKLYIFCILTKYFNKKKKV